MRVKAVMRHSSFTLTMDTYGHLLPGQEAATVVELPDIMLQAEPLDVTGTADDQADGRDKTRAAQKSRTAGAQRQTQRANAPVCDSASTDALASRIGNVANGEEASRRKAAENRHSGTDEHPMSFAAHARKRKAAGGSRIRNLQITNPSASAESSEKNCGSSNSAAHLQRATPNCVELEKVIAAWPALPDAIRAGILAMVNAAGG
jgi:hypothetical protein